MGRGWGDSDQSLQGKASTREENVSSKVVEAGWLGAPSALSPHSYRLLKMTSSQQGQLLMNCRV